MLYYLSYEKGYMIHMSIGKVTGTRTSLQNMTKIKIVLCIRIQKYKNKIQMQKLQNEFHDLCSSPYVSPYSSPYSTTIKLHTNVSGALIIKHIKLNVYSCNKISKYISC